MKVLPKEDSDDITYNYQLMVTAFFLQAKHDIRCYFCRQGTPEERNEGKKSLVWIKKMRGNFTTFASALGMPVEKFHQLLLDDISEIKNYARSRFHQNYKDITLY